MSGFNCNKEEGAEGRSARITKTDTVIQQYTESNITPTASVHSEDTSLSSCAYVQYVSYELVCRCGLLLFYNRNWLLGLDYSIL